MLNPAYQTEFSQGTVPDTLDGVYVGSILQIEPHNTLELAMSVTSNIWSPWSGKYFYRNGTGDNIFSPLLMYFVKGWFGDFFGEASSDGRFHAFPFSVAITQSVAADRPVLQLSYAFSTNPAGIAGLLEEIVWSADGNYLAALYRKDAREYTPFAYTRLTPHR